MSTKKKKRLGYYAGEKLSTLTENQLLNLKKEASLEAVETFFIVAALAAKETFYDLVDNESMEKLIKKLAYIINAIDKGDVTINTLINVVDAETGLFYDVKNRKWINKVKDNKIII